MEEISYRCLYHCRYSRELKTLYIPTVIFPSTLVYRVLPFSGKMGGKFQQNGDESMGVNWGAGGLMLWEKLYTTTYKTAAGPF